MPNATDGSCLKVPGSFLSTMLIATDGLRLKVPSTLISTMPNATDGLCLKVPGTYPSVKVRIPKGLSSSRYALRSRTDPRDASTTSRLHHVLAERRVTVSCSLLPGDCSWVIEGWCGRGWILGVYNVCLRRCSTIIINVSFVKSLHARFVLAS